MSIEDGMIRQQVLLEGLKGSQSKVIDNEITSVFDTYITRFRELEPDEFSGLSRTKVQAILNDLRSKAIAIYAKYSQALLDFLKKFVDVETTMTAVIIKNKAASLIRNPAMAVFNRELKDGMWASLQKEIMPSDGVNLKQVIDNLGSSIITDIESSIRRAIANLDKFGTWYDSIIGKMGRLPSGKVGRLGGLYNRHISNGRGMVETVIQHASSFVQRITQSKFFDQYYWRSVMDGRTSNICVERNGEIYTYGEGPVPPAHRRCRSRIVPVDGKRSSGPKDFVAWLKEQPDRFVNKILSSGDASKLRDGNLNASDLGRFKPDKDFSLDQYKNSLSLAIE